jgi:hypothetical protein
LAVSHLFQNECFQFGLGERNKNDRLAVSFY